MSGSFARSAPLSVCLATLCGLLSAQASSTPAASQTPASGASSSATASQTTASATSTTGSSDQPKPYVFALTVLDDGGLAPADRPFLSKLPTLVLDDLDALPPRYEDEAYRSAVEKRATVAALFDKGDDLYKKLDAAATARLDPSLSGYDRFARISSADGAVAKADDALSDLVADSGSPSATTQPWSLPRDISAWNGKGLLFDPGTDTPFRAGRKQSVDLVVTGTASPVGSYVRVSLEGYDVDLGKKVFSWTGFASPDDPEPLATEFAGKLSAWLAAEPMARFDLSVKPASARVIVDGKPIDSSEVVLFSPEERAVTIAAWAPGSKEEDRDILLVPGQDKGLVLDLAPQSYGKARISLEPSGADLLLGGVEADPSHPFDLEGIQDIAIASAPKYETKMAVLPASGDSAISIALRPSDGLGPGKRTDKAKDHFYVALGLVAIGVPLASIAQGYQNMYYDANYLQGFVFDTEYSVAETAYWTAVVLTAGAAVYTITQLVAMLGGMN